MRNPVIINVRGTSGSGKSTLVRNIMAQYPHKTPGIIVGRKQPLWYFLDGLPDRPGLVVPGHYEGACGGCDTISKFIPGFLESDPPEPNSYDMVFGLIRRFYSYGYDVLFEGLLISGDKARCLKLHQDGLPLHVVAFDLPVELCINSVLERRAAKGNTKEFDPKNTIDKHRLLAKCAQGLAAAGVPVSRPTTREEAVAQVQTLLST